MPGFGKRVSYAFKSFFGILSSGELPREVVRELGGRELGGRELGRPAPAAREPEPSVEDSRRGEESTDRAVQVLAILQRDGRLIDFLTEDISPYSDAQVGAAVRDLHESCKQTLSRYIALEPIIASDEGQPVTVQAPIDPASIKLTGNVTGSPPLRGVLRHRGWRATSVNLPPLPAGGGREVVAPAEVEIP